MVSSIESRQCQIEYFHNERVVKEQGLLLDVKHALENSIKKFFLVRETLSWEFLIHELSPGKIIEFRAHPSFNLVKEKIIYVKLHHLNRSSSHHTFLKALNYEHKIYFHLQHSRVRVVDEKYVKIIKSTSRVLLHILHR